MKILLGMEETALLGLWVYLYSLLDYSWWWLGLSLIAPDIGMVGYLLNNKVGAITYNFVHHRAVGIAIYCLGFLSNLILLEFIGLIILAHVSLDRILGYGLKHLDSFHHTHLGWIGKGVEKN